MVGARQILGMWLPDWPVQAAWLSGAAGDVPSIAPIAVIDDEAVIDCSASARRAGVRRGQPRRQAQASCPELIIAKADAARDAAEFEQVIVRVENIAAGVEALRPGLVVLDMHSPTHYYGSTEVALQKLLDAAALPGIDCFIGQAEDIVTAVLAARRGVFVPAGQGAAFRRSVTLAEVTAETAFDFPVKLTRTWADLGLRTLGDVAAIPMRDIANRFGSVGAKWRRLAEYGAVQLVSPRAVVVDLTVHHRLEEAVTRIDAAAFIARSLAVKLHELLMAHGLSCYRLKVAATFSDGSELSRMWRCAEPLTEAATADRVRWQLDGWLSQQKTSQNANMCRSGSNTDYSVDEEESGIGISELTLEPLDVVTAGEIKDALWGGADESDVRARRAAVRVQGLLGTEAVCTPVCSSGRGPAERIAYVAVGDEKPQPAPQWKGALPAPAPAHTETPVSHPAAQVKVLDKDGNNVAVTGRATMTAKPAVFVWGGQRREICSWAGPWPIDERWWVPDQSRRAARIQIETKSAAGDIAAFLLIGHHGKWRIEGRYD